MGDGGSQGSAPRGQAGDWIWQANAAGTLVFAATVICAAVIGGRLDQLAVIVSLSLFVLGCVGFVWSLLVATRRSGLEEMSVAGAFLLLEGVNTRFKGIFWSLVGIQLAVAFTGAGVRLYSPLAFAILAPVFGLGMMSLWGAKYARFPARFHSSRG